MKKAFYILAFSSLFFFSFKNNSSFYEPESIAVDFSLKNTNGTLFSLSSLKKAKGAIVIFTCNHCPYSKAYEDRIIALDKKYKRKGYPVVAINSNDSLAYPEDSYSKMKMRSKEKGFTFPYLLDETQELAKTYGANKTPHVFIIKKEKYNWIVKYIGAIDDNYENPKEVKKKYVEDAVNALLKNKTIETQTTKAIGCGIKWKKR
jgi:peroxiredoxin